MRVVKTVDAVKVLKAVTAVKAEWVEAGKATTSTASERMVTARMMAQVTRKIEAEAAGI
jgi:hypothetical protein